MDEPSTLMRSLLSVGQINNDFSQMIALGLNDSVMRFFRNVDYNKFDQKTVVGLFWLLETLYGHSEDVK